MRLWKKPVRSQEKGVFLILTALMLVVLFGIVGLAVDVSRQLVVSAELQNSADACALGGVLELNGAPDAPKRAAQTGRFVGGYNNLESFQHNNVPYAAEDITFSDQRDGQYLTPDVAPASAGFIKCTARHNSLVNVFMGVLGFKFSDLASVAIATMNPSQVTCMAPFMVVVDKPVDGNYPKGDDFGLSSKTVPYDSSQSNYPYLNLAAYQNINTNLVADFIASPNKCNIPTKPGTCLSQHAPSSASIENAWNTRFGLYTNAHTPGNSPPDRTGLGYTSYLDFNKYQTDAASNMPNTSSWGGGYKTKLDSAGLKKYGVTNRRVVALPVVPKLQGTCANGEKPILGWVCGWLLAPYSGSKEYPQIVILGSALAKNSPCGAMGIPGSDAYGPLVPALVQ